MTSQQLQYIIVFVILAAVVVWIIYSLMRKKPDDGGTCSCCPLASDCKNRDVVEKNKRRSAPCDDFLLDEDISSDNEEGPVCGGGNGDK